MPCRVEVIAGPAACGKTERLVARYRAELAGSTAGATAGATSSRCLWIAPTHRAATAVRRQLLAEELAGCLNPRVLTFEQLAEQIVGASPEVVHSIDRLVERRILAHLISEATSSGQLDYFRAVAESGSLVDLVTEWIIELKRLEIWPDQFEQACAERGLQTRDRELLGLYRQYQAHLAEHRLYDAEGRIWSARTELQQDGGKLLGDLRLVVADGFTDFTRTQHEILQSLADDRHFPNAQVCISLPLETATQRQHLFHKSLSTLKRLESYHASLGVEYLERDTNTRLWPTLAHIESQLFASPKLQTQLEESSDVEILAAESDLGEIEMIARRIKRLLLDGDDGRRRVLPQQIAVVFRSATPAAPLVAEVFDDLGIPFAIETPQRLGDAPAMSALVALLRLALDDWPFRALLGVLGSNYVDLTGDRTVLDARRSTQRIIRHLQIPRGRRKLLEQVARLANMSLDEIGGESRLSDYVGWARQAQPVLAEFADCLDILPAVATMDEWFGHLLTLAQRIGMVDAIENSESGVDAQIDRAAWQKLAEASSSAKQADAWAGQATVTLTLADLVHTLTDLCSHETLTPTSDDIGRVRVLSAPSVRGITVDYLFVAGLSEKSFPSLAQQEALYGDDDYRQLRRSGLPLVDHAERSHDEMLLFYEVITRVTRRLWLTYAALDENGQPLCPSPYLTEVERACGEGQLPHHREIRLSPVPEGPAPLSASEWRLLATAQALDHKSQDVRLLAAHGRESSLRPAHANLLAGLGVVAERQTGEGFGPYEGVLLDSAAPAILEQQFGASKLWSATELEEYGLSPHRFFLNHVLNIDESEELTLETDFGARGRALHETLTRAHRYLNERAEQRQSPSDLDDAARTEFQAQMLEMLRDTIADLPAGSDVDRALLEVNRREIEKWVLEYCDQHRTYDDRWKDEFDESPRPAHFEVAYGLKPRPGDDEKLSTRAAHEITLAGEKLKIAGRVDRIDVGQLAGQAVFNIVDYKTAARSPGKPGVIDGTSLQLELYAMATEELLLADEHALAWRAGYWMVRNRGFQRPLEIGEVDEGDRIRPTEEWINRRTAIIERLTRMVHGIRQGHFPMYSADDDCTGRCPYRTVCRVNQTRNLEKQWDV